MVPKILHRFKEDFTSEIFSTKPSLISNPVYSAANNELELPFLVDIINKTNY